MMDSSGSPDIGGDAARRAYWRAALAWQLDSGVDEAIEEAPIDRRTVADPPPVERARERAPARPKGGAGAQPAAAARSPEAKQAEALGRARALAEGASDIASLRAAVEGFDGSALKKGARSTVFADGNPQAALMVLGEAPGREEDRVGKPFVGRSGGLLDRMLNAIGLDRAAEDPAKAAYITNVIFYRPLENRTPDDAEVRLLSPFTERHIALARPKAVLCLGNVPAKHLMEARTGITKFRGTWTVYARDGLEIPMLATFHPAFLLRSPEMKRLAWRDLLALRARLDESG